MRSAFLSDNGWGGAEATLLGDDWSARRFWRIRLQGKSVILMESVPDDHPSATPGHRIADMIRIGAWLRGIGLRAPDIMALQEKEGFILMEDLGSDTLPLNIDAYLCAVKAMQEMQRHYLENSALKLPPFAGSRIDRAKTLIIDYALPLLRGKRNEGWEKQEFERLWDEMTKKLPPIPQTFLHVDYHAENLIWKGDESELSRLRIIDFQGAHFGPTPYDLVNLLEDIRRDVPKEIKEYILHSVFETMTAEEREVYRKWYGMLSAQFHCRVAGQVIRLFSVKNAPRYLALLPRIFRLLQEDLHREELKPLTEYFSSLGLKTQKVPEVNAALILALVDES